MVRAEAARALEPLAGPHRVPERGEIRAQREHCLTLVPVSASVIHFEGRMV